MHDPIPRQTTSVLGVIARDAWTHSRELALASGVPHGRVIDVLSQLERAGLAERNDNDQWRTGE